MREWLWRCMSLLRTRKLSSERQEELEFHFDQEVAAGLEMGLTRDAALRRARLRTGGVDNAMESSKEGFGFSWMHGFAADLRHAMRSLLRNRSFGMLALTVLAVTVAANTLVFCILEGVLLRPLPYRAPDRLVRVFETSEEKPKFPVSLGRYLELRQNARTLQSLALYTGGDFELTPVHGAPRQISGMSITPEFFSVLGTAPLLGRSFTKTEARTSNPSVIISHRMWREDFGGDPAILGKTIRLNRRILTVVGVAPAGFQHVGGDYRSPLQGETVDVWLPLNLNAAEVPLRAHHYCNGIARLSDGADLARAQSELTAISARYARTFPQFGDWRLTLQPLLREVTGQSKQVIWLLLAAAAIVLIVACTNIAGLCVARAVARRGEMAVRQALGANRWQLLRVGLAENLIVGIAGASIGVLLSAAAMPVLHHILPASFPRAHEIRLTPIATLFAIAIALLTSVAAALVRGGDDLLQTQRVAGGLGASRLRKGLVGAEVALAGLLCAGAFFLLRSYQELGARDHGFDPSSTLTFRLNPVLSPEERKDPNALSRFYQRVIDNIRAVPGVRAVGATTNLPWSGYDENSSFGIVGKTFNDADTPGGRYQGVSEDYFKAIGMRLVAGRFFSRALDGSDQPPTVIVNEALAQRYFPNHDALGSVLDLWEKQRRIVGVVASVRDRPSDLDAEPGYWFPVQQVPFGSMFVAVRANITDVGALTAAVTDAVHRVDRDLPLGEVRLMETRAKEALAARTFALWLFEAFAVLALLLAAAGVYGLLSYFVHQRRKELGIRAALGADRSRLGKMILTDGLKIASAGILVSLVLAPLGGALMRAFLFNVKAFDPATLLGALAVLVAVSLVASVGPARAAMRSDPAATLREN